LIKIWDAMTGDIIQTLSGHSEGISDIAWSAHSDYIASASDDNTVRIWNLDVSRCISYVIGLLIKAHIGCLGEGTERAHELCLLCELQPKV
jgi:WD40 repeat protein